MNSSFRLFQRTTRYKYYMTHEGAERGLKVSKLRIKLSTNDFRNPSDDLILEIAKLMELD